jgi:arylformamidase
MTARSGRTLDLTQPFFHNGGFNPDLPLPRIDITRSVISDGYSLEQLELCTHVGTHMDAPSHVLETGHPIDEFAVDRFHGPGVVVDLRDLGDEQAIDAEILASRARVEEQGSIVLLATGWGAFRARTARYVDGSPWLNEAGAKWLVEHGAAGVAIDHFSIAGRGPAEKVLPAHTVLLGAGVWIVEEALFPESLLDGSRWDVVALPWRIAGVSGAPTRMIAIEQLAG